MPVWIPAAVVRAMHWELLQEHGGPDGAIDENALGATLARPQQLDHYANPTATLPQLAAAYGFNFSRNHCFSDGNKRIALASIDVFLQMNGYELIATEVETVVTIQALAAGELEESQLAEWVSRNMQALEGN
jgi:death-on-curing protein